VVKQYCTDKLTKAHIPLGLSCTHVSTIHVRRVERVVMSVSSRACSNMVDYEEAVVLARTNSVFCALDLHQSQEKLLEK